MADLKIQDAPVATAANLTDLIPVSQEDSLAKVVTVQQIVDKVTPYSDTAIVNGLAAQVAVHTDTKEPTGFVDPDNISRSYDSTTRIVTLTALAGTLDYYWRGVKKTLGATWTSSAHADTNGNWFLYSTDGTNFTWSNTVWLFSHVQVAFASYGVSDKFAISEVHGCTMSYADHDEAHDNIGTYKKSGGGISDYVLASTVAANRRPLVASTLVKDEDLQTTVAELAVESYTVFNLTSANTPVFSKAQADIIPLLAARPYYNQFTGGAWQQTLMSANAYTCVWLVAVPVTSDAGSQAYRYLWVQGQSGGNLTSQQARTTKDVSFGAFQALATEFVFIGKIILQYVAANWVLTSVELLTGARVNQGSIPAVSYVSQTILTGNLLTSPSENAVATRLSEIDTGVRVVAGLDNGATPPLPGVVLQAEIDFYEALGKIVIWFSTGTEIPIPAGTLTGSGVTTSTGAFTGADAGVGSGTLTGVGATASVGSLAGAGAAGAAKSWWRLKPTAVSQTTNWQSFFQISMFASTDGTGTDLCIGATAFAKSVYAGYPASNANDANGTTRYANNYASGDALAEVWGAHLAVASEVHSMKIMGFTSGTAYFSLNNVLQSSTDTTNGIDGTWTDAATVTLTNVGTLQTVTNL